MSWAGPSLNYMRDHGVSIGILIGMTKDKINKALTYGDHASEVKEKAFIRREIEVKLWAGIFAIFTLAELQYLQGIWLYLLAPIQQTWWNPHLI